MNLYEYQAKELFREAGVPLLRSAIADTPSAAAAAARQLGGRAVVKAQVPIGGRGKAGGIKVGSSPEEVEQLAAQILGMEIHGYPVRRLLIEEAADIAAEYYLSITVDRASAANVIIASAAGGVDIEEVAASRPEAIAKVPIDAGLGIKPFVARQAAVQAGLPPEAVTALQSLLPALYGILQRHDALLVEINPLARLADGRIIALDGKVQIDDNALFRQRDLVERFRPDGAAPDVHPLEARARELGLAYVKLDGDVGIIGNGAGLVMATLDIVQREGGRPANFLDIGGGARAEVVRKALATVLSDPDVRSVLINVFGGITRGDEVARGLLAATEALELKVPVIVRLAGTRAAEGRALLAGSPLIPAETFAEAAKKAVAAARGGLQ
ncbi:MAG TPA: ADP-forming succinate--CoA ligase subunit beta [Limnochordia bacterium]